MNKRIMFLIFCVVGLMFISCDWNYSKSPEVQHYDIPEKRQNLDLDAIKDLYIITDNNGNKYFYDKVEEEIYSLKNEITPSGKKLNRDDYNIIFEDEPFTNKISKLQALMFNYDQWRDEQEIKPYWVKEFEVRGGDLGNHYLDYFTYEGLKDLNIIYRSKHDGLLYATVSCCLFDVDIDKVKNWFENLDVDNDEYSSSTLISTGGYGEISDSPYGTISKITRGFRLFEKSLGKRKINKECFD